MISTVKMFRKWLTSSYWYDTANLAHSGLMCVGQFEGKSVIVGIKNFLIDSIRVFNGSMIFSDTDASSYFDSHRGWFSADNYTAKQFLTRVIDDYGKSNIQLGVGGPVNIIDVTEQGARYIQKDPESKDYNTIENLYNDLRDDKIKITYLVPDSKQRILGIMKFK